MEKYKFIKNLSDILSRKDKLFLLWLLIFSVFIGIMETFAISIIMPFIAVATNFNLIKTNKYLNYLYRLFHSPSYVNFVVAFGIGIILFYIFRSVVNIIYFYLLAKFSQGRYHIIASRLFENYMGLSYIDFIGKTTANLTKNIVTEASNLALMLSSLLFMMSEVFVVIMIYGILLFINWEMTLLMTVFLSVNVFFLIKVVSGRIEKLGTKREKFQKKFYDTLSTSLGNFKLIKLKSMGNEMLDKFSTDSFGYADSNVKNQTFSNFPKIFLELIGFSLISLVVIYLVLKNHSDIRNFLPVISAFVLGLYRLMPSANRILTNYNNVMFYRKSLDIVRDDIVYKKEDLGSEEISFLKKIELKNIAFNYVENKPILEDISLNINKGEKIAIIGKTGSGKSTLIDLIIGLFKPQIGSIYIDDTLVTEKNIKSWRKKAGYIPQTIYLFDGTVAENVSFGKEFDEEKVKTVLKKANILDFLEGHHDGINTKVGEGGIKLSGGQKQRVAIARALYDDPEILVLDEATSSLDNKTEAMVMEEIYDLTKDKTLIIVAHRLSTIQGCDAVYKIKNGGIETTGGNFSLAS